MNILCLGAVLCDIAATTVTPEAIAKKRIGLDTLSVAGGGDGNNASIDLATFGESVRVVSRVGNDSIGGMLLNLLQAKGVDTRYVVVEEGAETTAAILLLGEAGSRTLSARHAGACDSVCEADVTDEALQWADHLHVVNVLNMPDLDGEGLEKLFARAHAAGVTTSMDMKVPRAHHDNPMGLIEGALKHCDIFMPSDHEIEYLCGISDPEKARDFFKPYGMKIFGMKRGKEGVYVTDFEEEVYQGTIFKGDPVDVVGAGDAFTSTFVAAYKRGANLRDAALVASAASARVISQVGSTAGMRDCATLLSDLEACGYSVTL